MNTQRWMSVITLVTPLLYSGSTIANSAEQWEYNLGTAANTSSKYIGSDEAEYYLFPVFEATYYADRDSKYYAGTVKGFGVETKEEDISFGLGINYRYGLFGAAQDFGLSDEEPEELQGMFDPGGTVTLKPYISVDIENWKLGLELDKGIERDNQGLTAKLSVAHQQFFSQSFMATFGVHITWADDEFIDDYFGVSDTEVTPTRAAYVGEAGLYHYGVMGELVYMLSAQSVIFGTLGVNVLGDKLQESSLVKEDIQPEVTVGYTYFF
ncbi:MipA/OmpV family protein [Pleionea sp. CnH1-48]|uniref:MipA/OmpV family protein n=1 Tax=Pleionea sp. CnH1-48 TaxID=2954494 RepID=UPI0020972252|nr:MipA/OmpV family protein [Pleionea sp. CnH1-48]MCO7224336.1 MipA/OmpV family protein [Pleionea sp. CnH1-48]